MRERRIEPPRAHPKIAAQRLRKRGKAPHRPYRGQEHVRGIEALPEQRNERRLIAQPS
jgi:hypothetical protein